MSENTENRDKVTLQTEAGNVTIKVSKKKGAKGQPEAGASSGAIFCCTIVIALD